MVKSILVVYGFLVILRFFHAARAAGSVPFPFFVWACESVSVPTF